MGTNWKAIAKLLWKHNKDRLLIIQRQAHELSIANQQIRQLKHELKQAQK